MSDFLNKFSKKDYKSESQEKPKSIETPKEEVKTVESKPVEAVKPTPVVSTSRHEEEVHIDPSYRRNQRNKIIIGAIAVVALLALSFGVYYLLNQVQIPDYVNKPLSELKTWASRNNIALETEYQFNLEVNKDYIIDLKPVANSNIQKGSILKVIVSDGADPDEQIQVPDFTGNTYYQIQEWLSTNKINNLRITYENNEDIPVNEFVRIVFNDKTITSDSYTRKDYGLIYLSNGPVVYEKNIKVPNWTTAATSVVSAQAWGLEKDVEVIVNLVNSTSVPKDIIISQSIAPDTMIAKKSKITVTVSLGQIVTVPDFSKMSKEEAENTSLSNAVVKYVEMYQPKTGATYGSYIWQDVKAGTNIDQSSATKLVITVYYSLGQPYLSSMVGHSEAEIPTFIYDQNLKSANFTFEVQASTINEAPKGTIEEMTPFNQFVDPGTKIIFKISDGSNYTP